MPFIEGPVMTITLFAFLLLVLVYMKARFHCFLMHRVHNVSNAILSFSMEAVWPSNQRTILGICKMLINVLFNVCCINMITILIFCSQKSRFLC